MLHNIVMSDLQIIAPVPMTKRFPFPNSMKGSKTKIYTKINPIGILPIKNRNQLLSYFVYVCDDFGLWQHTFAKRYLIFAVFCC